MPAAIVLHGLILLTCHGPQAVEKNMCEIRIPSIAEHKNFIGIPAANGGAASWAALKPGSYELKGIGQRTCDHAKRGCNPFLRGTADYNLQLASSVKLSNARPAITVAKIPIPDGILGGSQVDVNAATLLDGTARDALLSPSMGARAAATYTISDSIVLYYNNADAFSVTNTADGSVYSSKPITPRSTVTNVLVISSEPYAPGALGDECTEHPRHDANFNAMLLFNNRPTTFHLTGNIGGMVKGPDAAASFFFDDDVLKPSCTPPVRTLERTSCGAVIKYDEQ